MGFCKQRRRGMASWFISRVFKTHISLSGSYVCMCVGVHDVCLRSLLTTSSKSHCFPKRGGKAHLFSHNTHMQRDRQWEYWNIIQSLLRRRHTLFK